MFTIAYLANEFPSAVEPYVGAEIEELRKRGIRIVAGSVRKSRADDVISLQPFRTFGVLRALGLLFGRWKRVAALVRRVTQSKESPWRKVKALLHTFLGAYYAALLQKHRVQHIHVHHGYFGSWVGMAAAEMLGIGYSLTLHGSDLLLHDAYLDAKLAHCSFCVTVSEYNRRYILRRFPAVNPAKILVSRLGVEVSRGVEKRGDESGVRRGLSLLAVGRLHAVKDHAFLVRACACLRDLGLEFECLIAGDGPERERLELLIREKALEQRVRLLGHVESPQMDFLYRHADVVALTSRSEGIPLVLMEAMARGRIVIAPAITGIPELVIPGKTGFLYDPGSLSDFVSKVSFVAERIRFEDRNRVGRLDWMRHAARAQVLHNFQRETNLARFANLFLQFVLPEKFVVHDWSSPHASPVLQQVQLPL